MAGWEERLLNFIGGYLIFCGFLCIAGLIYLKIWFKKFSRND